MDPGKIFQIITNSTLLATRLLSGSGAGPLEFTQPHYCTVLREDAQLAATVLNVTAIYKEGAIVRYAITGGNRDGLFTIDQHTGTITLAAALDYELYDKHELVISGEANGHMAHTIVQVRVADVNDNPPAFVKPEPQVTVIEEDDRYLPVTLLKVEAKDKDDLDYQGLLYTVRGDGVDGYSPSEAFFTINSLTGELIQKKALDRDPPLGKAVWKVRVQVRDGQALWSRPRNRRQVTRLDNERLSSETKNATKMSTETIRKRAKRNVFYDQRTEKPNGDGNQHYMGYGVNYVGGKVYKREFTEGVPYSFDPSLSLDGIGRNNSEENLQKKNMRFENLTPTHTLHSDFSHDVHGYESNLSVSKLSQVSEGLDPSYTKQYFGKPSSLSLKRLSKYYLANIKQNRRRIKLKSLEYMDITTQHSHGNSGQPFPEEKERGLKSMMLEYAPPNRQVNGLPDGIHSTISTRLTIRAAVNKTHRRKKRKSPLRTRIQPVEKRAAGEIPLPQQYGFGSSVTDGGCEDDFTFSLFNKNITKDPPDIWATADLSAYGSGGRMGRVHVVETIVTIFVKDINDNPPVFPNATLFGEVQENGPIDLSVAVVSAWDADDADEGSNAKITYSIEKNVVHERSGEAIFNVHPQTGLITTAVCCLDRETTPEYYIQVVATDGGGLKGTGAAIVQLSDVNDNSPRLSKKIWEVEVNETRGNGPPDNSTLLEISVNDKDTANYFFYRVVDESGWGWEHFGIRSKGTSGQIYARQTLDYEDDTHRRGFRFMIQVTDRGRGGWVDPRHLDWAWVAIRLKDVNDNPPLFHRPHAHVTIREDALPGTLLAALPAHDPDMGGQQNVKYRVAGGWGALKVDAEGSVSLWRSLDREAPGGSKEEARIIAVDSGQPPLTSTATLTITVSDVNDCPPRLLPPTAFHVTEGVKPTLLGILTATDRDVWALGHGPPFNFSLDPSNLPFVLAHVDIRYYSHLDSGRGGAEVWTKDSIDREEYRELAVGILLRDAGGLTNTQNIRVVIDDVNDNPMKPAAKTVYLWKTQTGRSNAPLGRVYVNDPDDWDVGDKIFEWVGSPHPLFTLNTKDGTIFASDQVREGRYELQFMVSDLLWGQKGVSANVTVAVRLLTQEALIYSTPITLLSTTPTQLTSGWTPTKSGGGLGRLVEGVKQVMGDTVDTVEVVSIYESSEMNISSDQLEVLTTLEDPSFPIGFSESVHTPAFFEADYAPVPSTCVWISIKETGGRYMDPVKLQGVLSLQSRKLEKLTNLTISVETPSPVVNENKGSKDVGSEEQSFPLDDSSPTLVDKINPFSAASRASTSVPLQVVDSNTTSIVTPRLTRTTHCTTQVPESCTPSSCLNGGRCIRSSAGNRCICPSGSNGSQCKILSRTFEGSGFIWVRPLPSCLPTIISLKVLTRHPDAILLYSGPLGYHKRNTHSQPVPLLALQVVKGLPQMLIDGGIGPLKLQVSTNVNDGNWHTIHAHLDAWGASLMVDLCGQGWDEDNGNDDSHCVTRRHWNHPKTADFWFSSGPLQLGGLAHSFSNSSVFEWKELPLSNPLHGCLSHVTINGQLMDLGEPVVSQGSMAGCIPQESACPPSIGSCGIHGECVGGLNQPLCQCKPGWMGPKCSSPTLPASFGSNSYIKMALSITPASWVISVQIRVRTRGRRTGLLIRLAAQNKESMLSIELRAGVPCLSFSFPGQTNQLVCVEGRPVGDGEWHTLRAERHGHNLIMNIDDGDSWRHNHTLSSFLNIKNYDDEPGQMEDDRRASPLPFRIDHGNVQIGGLPEIKGAKRLNVNDDLEEVCLDDLRISGQPVPLTSTPNATSQGQVIESEGVVSHCNAPDACVNISCLTPLTCTNNWGQASCSCGDGRHLIGRICEDVDECLWRPCLHGGTCYNMRPGFACVCGPGHTGDHCQWTNYSNSSHPLATPAALAVITLSLVFLVLVGVVLSLVFRRHWSSRGMSRRQSCEETVSRGLSSNEATIIEVKDGTNDSRRESTALAEPESKTDIPQGSLDVMLPYIDLPLQLKEKKPQSITSMRRGSKISANAVAVLKSHPANTSEDNLDLARDDLRAYAYEGEGSSAGSLSSALSGLRVDESEEGIMQSLVPSFLDVVDLLKNLPEGSKSPTFINKRTSDHNPEDLTSKVFDTANDNDDARGIPTILVSQNVESKDSSKEEISTIC